MTSGTVITRKWIELDEVTNVEYRNTGRLYLNPTSSNAPVI
jgi:hypothetical protein